MDEIKRLEREISDLQKQLKKQNDEAAKARKKLIEENRRQLQAYQADMERAVKEHDRTAQERYQQLLRQYQQSLGSEVEAELAGTDAEYRRLVSDVRQNEAMLLQKNQELERIIETMKRQTAQKDEGSRAEAAAYLKNATGTFHEVEAKPHEKFMPKRLEIFFGSIRDGQQLYQAGLYEAASAVAISAKAGLERLSDSIDDKAEEWDRQFDLFTLRLNYLRQKIKQELTDWEAHIQRPSGGDFSQRKQRLIELNFWTRGEYAAVVMAAKEFQRVAAEIEAAGREAYLRQEGSASTDDLKRYVEKIDNATKQLESLSGMCPKRYDASCQRSDWGEEIIDFFTDEINLDWIEQLTGFKAADAQTLSAKDFRDYVQSAISDAAAEDPREWLRVVFENASGNRIYVYLIPVESGGNVSNRVILHIDYGGAEQELYSRDIYAHICEAIGLGSESEGIVNYAADVGALKLSRNKIFSETGRDLEKMKRCAGDANPS